MKKYNRLFIHNVILFNLFFTELYAAPISFNTALPVASGEYLFRQQLLVSQSGDDPSTNNRDRSEFISLTTLGYGINHQWTIFGTLPYRDISLKLDVANERIERSNNGLADFSLFTRYIAYKKNNLGKTFRVAPFIGLKAPTGEDNASDNRGRLPKTVQLSSGSLDVFGGLVLTWQTLQQQIDTQISYRVNNEKNGFSAGNILRLDGSYQYRVWRSATVDSIPDYFYLVIESNLIQQEKNRINGTSDNNSNGTRLFISPGIQYVTMRWIAEFALQLPVIQNLNGLALENAYITRSSFRVNF